jgi:hypothetical protein
MGKICIAKQQLSEEKRQVVNEVVTRFKNDENLTEGITKQHLPSFLYMLLHTATCRGLKGFRDTISSKIETVYMYYKKVSKIELITFLCRHRFICLSTDVCASSAPT